MRQTFSKMLLLATEEGLILKSLSPTYRAFRGLATLAAAA